MKKNTTAPAVTSGKFNSPYDYSPTMQMIGKQNLDNLSSDDLSQIHEIIKAWDAVNKFDLLAMLCNAYMLGHMAGIRTERRIRHEAEAFDKYNDTLDAMAYKIFYNKQLREKQRAINDQQEELTEIRARLGLYGQPEPQEDVDEWRRFG